MEALQSRAAVQSPPVVPGAAAGNEAESPDGPPVFAPEDVFGSLTAAEYSRARQPLPPPSLNGKPGLQDFDLTGNPQNPVRSDVAKRFGLETVYDGDYPAAGRQIRFRISGVDFREALHDLEAMTDSFVVPLSSSLFMVARTRPKAQRSGADHARDGPGPGGAHHRGAHRDRPGR